MVYFDDNSTESTDCEDISVGNNFERRNYTRKGCQNGSKNKQNQDINQEHKAASTEKSTTTKDVLMQNIIPFLKISNITQRTDKN